MKTAYIIEVKDKGKTLVIRDEDGSIHGYIQGDGLEECPTVLHADIMGWHPNDLKAHLVKYEGTELPELLFIRDGSPPGYHKYHRAE
jgi:hypothetical protein